MVGMEKAEMSSQTPFFSTLEKLRQLMRNDQTPEANVPQILPLLSDDSITREFFQMLDDPRWIAPLERSAIFDKPLGAERVQGGDLRCRVWPQSGYLARMAVQAAHEVADIFVAIKTDNWLVACDIIDGAKAMSADQAARLAPKIGELTQRLHLWYKLQDIGEIVARLVAEDQADPALELARGAFAVSPGEGARQRQQHGYGYFDGLNKSVIPSLVPVRPRETLQLLTNWLTTATESTASRREAGEDYSYMWRPAIEDHAQNRDHDFASKLVSPVRDAFELAIRRDKLSIDEALQILQQKDYTIYKRLRLHLICEFAEQHPDLARETMLDKELFGDYRAKHEYARLMGLRFDLLDTQQKAEWYKWVNDGPEAIEPDFFDKSVEDELRKRQADYWKFQHLYWIREHLSGKRLEFYEQMLNEHGKPTLADFNIYSGEGRWGHDTPYTSDDLAAMEFEAAVAKVVSWRPDREHARFDGPSTEGLASSFLQYVKTDPVRFSSDAVLLKHKPAVYVRSFLQAMKEAVREGTLIHIRPVLALCAWIVSGPVEEQTSGAKEEGALVDRGWQWCRDTIAEFIQDICNAKDDAKRPRCGPKHREALWEVLKPLLDSPTRSYFVKQDAEKDPRLTDWALLMLNSPRGKAMLAVLAYADWVATDLHKDHDKRSSFSGGFTELQEVRDVLEAQLTRADDHFTARAAFGSRLRLLLWLDAEWLGEHVDSIFDLETLEQRPQEAYGWAAWNTFLVSARPHIDFYKMLRSQFDYAVNEAMKLENLQESLEQPFARLAEHLMVLYGRGDLGQHLEEAWKTDGGIIRRLVTLTDESVRSRAIEFVGMSLQDADDNLREDIVERFKSLWERYWKEVGENDAKRNPTSSVFGYWFTSEVFEPRWSIQQLENFVRAANKAQPEDIIMERLAQIAGKDQLRSAQIVGYFVEGDHENWQVGLWKESAKTILEVALKKDGKAKTVAEGVIDLLGRRGYVEFGDLLEEQQS